MKMNELKKLVEEHDECSHKLEVIDFAVSNDFWMEVTTPRGSKFYLSKEDIEALRGVSLNKLEEIEKVVNELSEE